MAAAAMAGSHCWQIERWSFFFQVQAEETGRDGEEYLGPE
jgi:hypothetical protein